MNHLTMIIIFSAIIFLECFILFQGQRKLFWYAVDATGNRIIGYLIAAPGTILHEAAHYIMCVLLRVPVGSDLRDHNGKKARVKLFYPQRNEEDGSITLGSVPHGQTDPLRGAFIAIAPLILVPPLFILITWGLFSSEIFVDPWKTISSAAIWKIILWLYVAFSAGQASFPSPGDHIGFFGAIALILFFAFGGYILVQQAAITTIYDIFRSIALILLLPAISALTGFIIFTLMIKVKTIKNIEKEEA